MRINPHWHGLCNTRASQLLLYRRPHSQFSVTEHRRFNTCFIQRISHFPTEDIGINRLEQKIDNMSSKDNENEKESQKEETVITSTTEEVEDATLSSKREDDGQYHLVAVFFDWHSIEVNLLSQLWSKLMSVTTPHDVPEVINRWSLSIPRIDSINSWSKI